MKPTQHKIRAIPTTYKGVNFRSRLEADFAATFDTLRIAWDYEPEGFELRNGMRYLPDFWLPDLRTWIEVKGDHLQRVDKFEAFAAQLWDEAEPDEHGERTPDNPNLPSCMLATTSRELSDITGETRVIFLGVRSPGSHYSVALAQCVNCLRVNIWTLGAEACRACRAVEASDVWWRHGYYGPEYQNTFPLQPLTRAPVKQWRPVR